MKVEKFDYNSADELLANTYIIYDDKKAVVIDPSKKYDGVVNFLNKRNLELEAILLTHGHFDHFGGVEILLKAFPKAKTYIEEHDFELLQNPEKNCSYMSKEKEMINIDCEFVNDKKIIPLFEEDDIEVIHTPFHTMGSVCYYFRNNNWLFSGDTLFSNGIGRYDLPTSCPRLINNSLAKLKELPKNVKVYPGHGPNTTIGQEFNF